MNVPSDNELAWTPAWKLSELMASRALSPVEYARYLLDRIERAQDLGAFISVFPDYLLKSAGLAEAAIMRGDPLPALHGIPLSVKDTLSTSGLRTTWGSKLFSNYTPNRNSVSVERARQAGGIVFAKANTPEFAMNRRSVNLVSRETLNPWDMQRTSGGSSGGSAVAVAAGLGPLSIGTDGGGSIRIPSAFNGVFGLYPSRGLTPEGAGFYDAPNSGAGPIARDVRDAALLLQIMAGPDPRDPISTVAAPVRDYVGELEDGVAGIIVAWSPDFGRITPERPEVVEACHALALVFDELGAQYSEPGLCLQDPMDALEPDPEFSMENLFAEVARMKGSCQDVFAWARALPPEQFKELSIYMRDRSDRPTALEYTMAIPPAVRNRRKDRLAKVFKQYDLVLCPVIARPAFVAGEPGVTPFSYTAYTYLVNLAGYCGASVPAGFVDGMPVGLQIIGRPGAEHLLLRAARALEKVRPWANLYPPHAPRDA